MNDVSIGIIGMGWVGTGVASSILHKGICRELLLNDARKEIAEGEAMDFNHGSPFYSSAEVRAVEIEEMLNCKAIVITAGRGGKPDESRLDLLKENIKIVKNISAKLKGFKGILIIVANPVDILTYFYQKYTKLPPGQVIGTGTMLDTARLREMIGKKLALEPKSVHAQVIGEHGDSEVVLWSRAMIGGIPLREWKDWNSEYESEIGERVRRAAYEIIKRKGATNHAIGLVTATLLKWILRGEKRIINLSTLISGPYGINDIAISLPSMVSNKGVIDVLELKMTDSESKALQKSVRVISDAINSVKMF
ncbi:L-lactate dehydrogenase [Hyphobacterium sp. CCMP332]|nr:L-lactate dehydrogenase [Hyphobacterium sp. CCMP332]